jgi:hypothetical protein
MCSIGNLQDSKRSNELPAHELVRGAPKTPAPKGILSDLFPGVDPPDVDYVALRAALAGDDYAKTPRIFSFPCWNPIRMPL